MTKQRLITLVAVGSALAGVAIGGILIRGHRWVALKWQRPLREWFCVKAVHHELPVEILEPIKASPFETYQILALIETESGGRAKAVSPSGAIGAMQVMPRHATDRGYSVDDLFDPVINVTIGVDVLENDFAKRYKWVEYHYISGYNCGTKKWDRALASKKAPPGETIKHWRRYRKRKERFRKWIEEGLWTE